MYVHTMVAHALHGHTTGHQPSTATHNPLLDGFRLVVLACSTTRSGIGVAPGHDVRVLEGAEYDQGDPKPC